MHEPLPQYFSTDWTNVVLEALPETPGLVVFDVDWTLSNGRRGARFEVRPGTAELFEIIANRRHRLALWSAAGAANGRRLARHADVEHLVSGSYRKPPYPPTSETAIAVLGEPAVLVIDDAAEEAVPGWNFVQVDPFHPYVGLTEQQLEEVAIREGRGDGITI